MENVSISIYPNPVENELTISGVTLDEYTIDIVDVQGRVVVSNVSEISQNKISTSNLTSGVYFLNIRSGNQSSKTIRFIKK
ncbi:MAG TPA: hypothetical protein DEG69_23820 [Flavobacteriaceae bacterium]|nr:hypothetical protein [Flavobacteriaceae bacterium]